MTKVLVVEDNEANLELMTYLLEASGYETIAARDGEEGLTTARETLPDIVLLDLHMPKLSGFQALPLIKQEPALRGTPVVAVTALAMVGDREKVLAAGFDGYISKPIAPETFIAQVGGFLQSHRERRC